MFSGLKNFAINRILRHVADSARLNIWTNWISIILFAAIGAGANWALLISEFQHDTPEGRGELLRVSSVVVGAVLMYLTGKFPFLKAWLPVAQDIVLEAEQEVLKSKSATAGK